MAVWIDTTDKPNTADFLARVLQVGLTGERAKFLVDPGQGMVVVQRLRVALSRSRERNRRRGKKNSEFTLSASTFPYTELSGKRHECVVMWVRRSTTHEHRELLDDLMERN